MFCRALVITPRSWRETCGVAGTFAFAPALGVERSWLLDQTTWLRHWFKWADLDPPENPWRFEAMPINALAELQLLSRAFRQQISDVSLNTPVFIAQSTDDPVVATALNQRLFTEHMPKNLRSRSIRASFIIAPSCSIKKF